MRSVVGRGLVMGCLLLGAVGCATDPASQQSGPTAIPASPISSEVDVGATPGASMRGREPAQVTFTTSDGLEIVADQYGDGEVGIVLGHMLGGDSSGWEPVSRELASRGYRVLAIDFRGHGSSAGPFSSPNAYLDILAAIEYLRDEGVERIAVGGASLGATASARAAQETDVDALVLVSSSLSWGGMTTTRADLADMHMPKLFACALLDPTCVAVEALSSAAAEPRAELWVEGATHGTHLLATDQSERLITGIADFLEEHLPAD